MAKTVTAFKVGCSLGSQIWLNNSLETVPTLHCQATHYSRLAICANARRRHGRKASSVPALDDKIVVPQSVTYCCM